ncbi:MAG: hypothetical protein M0Z65_03285 [Firmicutes bacterium]|nr:hypothetical protein [Melghirimyces thermohalophilus]MDA8352203.1 hypothetical protein [Bacillota bacterium]
MPPRSGAVSILSGQPLLMVDGAHRVSAPRVDAVIPPSGYARREKG